MTDAQTQQQCEISWFSALCDDDYEFLGVPDPYLQSSWEHCRNIVMRAEEGGFDNILLPSGYQLGLDTTAFASAIAVLTKRIKLLMAVRIGESWPPQLARQIATLDQISGGRLNVNIISSDLPGDQMDSEPRYRRTVEAMRANGAGAWPLRIVVMSVPQNDGAGRAGQAGAVESERGIGTGSIRASTGSTGTDCRCTSRQRQMKGAPDGAIFH